MEKYLWLSLAIIAVINGLVGLWGGRDLGRNDGATKRVRMCQYRANFICASSFPASTCKLDLVIHILAIPWRDLLPPRALHTLSS